MTGRCARGCARDNKPLDAYGVWCYNMGMERTETTDQFGNVSYELHQDGELVGRILKSTSGYRAELPSGSGRSVTSIRKGEELISFWRRMAA